MWKIFFHWQFIVCKILPTKSRARRRRPRLRQVRSSTWIWLRHSRLDKKSTSKHLSASIYSSIPIMIIQTPLQTNAHRCRYNIHQLTLHDLDWKRFVKETVVTFSEKDVNKLWPYSFSGSFSEQGQRKTRLISDIPFRSYNFAVSSHLLSAKYCLN